MRLNLLGLVVLLGLAAALIGQHFRADRLPPPAARHGVLDWRTQTLPAGQQWLLDGEWRLSRQPLTAPPAAPGEGLLTFPGEAKKLSAPPTPVAQDLTTLHLRLHPPQAAAPLGLQVSNTYRYLHYRLWLNGHLVAERNLPYPSAEDSRPHPSNEIIPLPNDGQPVELVFQATGHHLSTRQHAPLRLGEAHALQSKQHQVWMLAVFSLGTLLLMGFYHLALYGFRRRNLTALYFGLYCLLWGAQVLFADSGDWVIEQLWADLPGETLYRIWQLLLYLFTPIAYLFYRSLYPQEFPRGPLYWLTGVSALYVLFALFLPSPLLATLAPFFLLVTLARMLFTVSALFLAAQRRRDDARLIFNGYVLVLLLCVNDILNGLTLIDTLLIAHFGTTVFMFVQSIVLARRFSFLFTTVEQLSAALHDNNRSLANEIAERTRLQQEVVSVSSEERRRISHQLHDGLCQQLTGARLMCTALESMWPADDVRGRGLRELATTLDASLEQSYDISRGLWPMGVPSQDICAALAALAKQQSSAGVPVIFSADNGCQACFTSDADHLYGIAREAVLNAIKHARASRIELTLACTDAQTATLTVIDNGCGQHERAPGKGGLGMRIMRYRAQMIGGECRWETPEAGGTRVVCTLHCQRPHSLSEGRPAYQSP